MQETFNNIRSALDIREKLLTRQIDAIHHQNRHRKTKLIDQMKFLPDNQENVLAHIRMLGKFNLDNFQTSDLIVEDYISPNDDHDLMHKGFNGNLESNLDESTVLDFSNNKALINENANNINDSIINITLNESRELIEESRELIERAKLFEFDEFLAEKPEKVVPMEEEPVTKVKRNSQKIKIHNCSGTINLKNISKLTINANCRGTDKKDNLTFTSTSSSSGTNTSTPTGNDANCATYNCEFYNRLINEIKNCVRRSDDSDMPSTTKDSSSLKNNSSSAFTPDSNSFDSHCKKILLKNIKNLKIQIPDGNNQLNGYLDANTITHPVQIEEWLKQIISETEIEPMQNVEILEHSIINTPSTPTSP